MDTGVRRGLGWALIGATVLVAALLIGLAAPNTQRPLALVALVGFALTLFGSASAGWALVRRRHD